MSYHVKSAQELEDKLKEAESNLVVIDFYATWCGPCRMIAPKLEEMAALYPDIMFLKVDVDECEDIAATYEISVMPTFIFIKEKQKIESFSGGNYEKLKEVVIRLK
ncbi:thioredoxin-2-like [Cimex lectularius]|uniref:Thioredoxin n=1 Tax=Cimex lectularius TaxID=79782 RepID=A0A8I6SLY1_CIMLE|nr:thioredoxin-2-like [Cimex lectularius]XP_024084106.1 thioredoxin-2-like [Cimex lectularius]XP_024084107.1 thioredoxin-2-like [Cimex lectularius]